MKNYTDINILVDRSGSMSSIADDMVGGLRTFLKQEKDKKIQNDVVSYYMFDDDYDVVFENKSLKDVKDEDVILVPRGWTALRDALGRTINSVGERLAKTKEEDRPNRVLFVCITDGMDNRSKEFTHEKIKEMVEHQRDKYAWDFVFLGANIDSFATGGSLGINRSSTRDFVATTKGINEAFMDFSSGYAEYSTLDRNIDRKATFSFIPPKPAENVDLSNITIPASNLAKQLDNKLKASV